MRAHALAAAATMLLAGCLSGAPAEEVATTAVPELGDLTDLLVVDHDHADPALHAASSPNVHAGNVTDLALDGEASDSNSALDVVGDWAVVGLVGKTSGFALVDVSDPANPVTVSRYLAPNVYGADVKFNHDASLVFLATSWTDPTNPANAQKYDLAQMTDPLASPTIWGVYVVDVSDKANPRLESTFAYGRGAHTVHYHQIGGREYVLLCTYQFHNAATVSKENPLTTKVIVTELVEGLNGARYLQHVSEYTRNVDAEVIAGAKGRVFPHELTVSEAPADGKTYAWVSYWDEGLVVLDLTDPANPVEVAQWNDLPEGDGSIHYAATFPQLIHGTQVTIVGPEWFSHETSGHWWALDTTDLADIKLLGFWTLPGEPAIEEGYRFSPHNFDLYGTWVIGANYHGGVWIWDVDRLVRHFGRDPEPLPDAAASSGRGGSSPGGEDAYASAAFLTPSTFRLPMDVAFPTDHGESKMEGHSDLVDVVGYHVQAYAPRSSYYGGEGPMVWSVLLQDSWMIMSDMETGLTTAHLADVPADADGAWLKGPMDGHAH